MQKTKWIKVETEAGYKGPAVYKISLRDKNCKPIPISRFLEEDAKGILFIGSTKDMERRRKQCINALKNNTKGHACRMLRFLKIKTKFTKKFPKAEFYYSFSKRDLGEDAKKGEGEEIRSYLKKYGEVPVLNSDVPNRGRMLDENCQKM